MKYKGRIIGLLIALSIVTVFTMYLHMFYGYTVWISEILLLPLLGCLGWWLGMQFDKVSFFAERDHLQNQELKRRQEMFQTIFEKAGIGISLLDKQGNILMVNPKLQDILGYTEEELTSMRMADISYPDDVPENMELLKDLMQRKIDYYQLEKRYIRKDGRLVWGKVTSSLFPGEDQDSSYVIGMMLEITQRKVAEQQLREANQMLEHLSNRDGLTGIANRRFFDEYFAREWADSLQRSFSFSLMILDIDFFKRFNDTYGHLAGDDCLKKVACTLEQTIQRPKSAVCRFGGEEFIVVLPETNQEEVKKIAEKARAAIATLAIPNIGSEISPFVTVSIGTATITPEATHEPQEFILSADQALYTAKQNGKNRVEQTKEKDLVF